MVRTRRVFSVEVVNRSCLCLMCSALLAMKRGIWE